jgi:hypothetical protein
VIQIVDPDNTLTMPPNVVAASGFDVLCHSLEYVGGGKRERREGGMKEGRMEEEGGGREEGGGKEEGGRRRGGKREEGPMLRRYPRPTGFLNNLIPGGSPNFPKKLTTLN